MEHYKAIILLLSLMMLWGAGCVSEQGIDKAKFSEVSGIVHELKAAMQSANPCDVPETSLQRLADGIAVLKDRASSKAERDVVIAYSRLLATFKDGVLLCQYRTQSKQFEFIPRGRIYVFQELDPVVEKYGLATKKHVYKPTGVHWRSIPGDSVKMIWESAKTQIRNIDIMVNYN